MQAGRTVGQGAVEAGAVEETVADPTTETAGLDEPTAPPAEEAKPGTEAADTLGFPVSVAVTGQTVVPTTLVSVTRTVERAGQLVTVAAQLIVVEVIVVKIVDVVN